MQRMQCTQCTYAMQLIHVIHCTQYASYMHGQYAAVFTQLFSKTLSVWGKRKRTVRDRRASESVDDEKERKESTDKVDMELSGMSRKLHV